MDGQAEKKEEEEKENNVAFKVSPMMFCMLQPKLNEQPTRSFACAIYWGRMFL